MVIRLSRQALKNYHDLRLITVISHRAVYPSKAYLKAMTFFLKIRATFPAGSTARTCTRYSLPSCKSKGMRIMSITGLVRLFSSWLASYNYKSVFEYSTRKTLTGIKFF